MVLKRTSWTISKEGDDWGWWQRKGNRKASVAGFCCLLLSLLLLLLLLLLLCVCAYVVVVCVDECVAWGRGLCMRFVKWRTKEGMEGRKRRHGKNTLEDQRKRRRRRVRHGCCPRSQGGMEAGASSVYCGWVQKEALIQRRTKKKAIMGR